VDEEAGDIRIRRFQVTARITVAYASVPSDALTRELNILTLYIH